LATECLYKIAQALTKHVQGTVWRRNTILPAAATTAATSTTNTAAATGLLTPEQIVDSIHVLRVHDETAQTATLYSLPHFLEQLVLQNNDKDDPPVKLIVIDSIAFHYRAITLMDLYYYLKRTNAYK
jgi:hypothetical protein